MKQELHAQGSFKKHEKLWLAIRAFTFDSKDFKHAKQDQKSLEWFPLVQDNTRERSSF